MARRAVEESLAKAVPPPVLNDAKLLVSELVTNSIQHAELEPDDSIELSVEVDEAGGVIRVTVADPGPGFEPSTSVRRASALGGRGLWLIEQIATRWGRQRNGGAVVWFELLTA